MLRIFFFFLTFERAFPDELCIPGTSYRTGRTLLSKAVCVCVWFFTASSNPSMPSNICSTVVLAFWTAHGHEGSVLPSRGTMHFLFLSRSGFIQHASAARRLSSDNNCAALPRSPWRKALTVVELVHCTRFFSTAVLYSIRAKTRGAAYSSISSIVGRYYYHTVRYTGWLTLFLFSLNSHPST